jgi:SWI/SNF-related matrix-associated actin-dependent regulator 1 of chromatin subfamily A
VTPKTAMPHQLDGKNFLLNMEEFKLLHWDMGTGKTMAAILALKEIEEPTLILVHKVALEHWRRELEAELPPDRFETVQVIKTAKDKIVGDIIVVSYSTATRPIMRPSLVGMKFTTVILDEIQSVKDIRSLRTKAVLGYGHFRKNSLCGNAKRIWGLTGTPAPNDPSEMYAWLNKFTPDLVPRTRERFIEQYLKSYETPWGPKIIGVNDDTMPGLMKELEPQFFRVRKEDVLHDLPPMQISEMAVDGGALMKQILQGEEELKDEILEALAGGNPGEHVAKLRRLIEMAKMHSARDMIDAELTDGAYEKIVIFAHHRMVISDLVSGLGDWGVSQVHGGVTGTARQKAIDDFQDGSNKVFVGQTLAAGTSITLHANGRCTNALAISLDWTPGNNAQAFARIHRKGQTGHVFIRCLHLADSLDQHVTTTLARKTRMLNKIFGETDGTT